MSLKSRLNQTHYSHADKKIKQSKKKGPEEVGGKVGYAVVHPDLGNK